MNYIVKNKLILSIILVLSIGFNACTMKDELTVVTPKTLEAYKTEMTDYLANQKLIVETTVVGYNKNNFKSKTDSATVKPAYLAAIIAAQAVVNDPAVTISLIATADKSITVSGKAFWAALWVANCVALSDTIAEANALYIATIQGNLGGQVLPDAKSAFNTAISKATTVRGATVMSDLLLKITADTLSKAKSTFIAAIIPLNINDYITRTRTYLVGQKARVDASVIGYNKGEYSTLKKTSFVNAIQVASDAVEKSGATFQDVSTGLLSLIGPRNLFLPFLTDHTTMNDTIIIAEALYNSCVVGTAKGQVVSAQKTALNTAINTAKTARENVTLAEGATKAARYAIGRAIFKLQASITLGDLIIDSDALKTATLIGTGSGKVSAAVNSEFNIAITYAKKIRDTGTSTWSQMDGAITILMNAKNVFTASILP